MAQANAPIATFPNWDAGIYDMMPEVLVVLFVVATAVWARKPLKSILDGFATRVKRGAAVRIGQFQIGALRVSNTSLPQPKGIECHKDIGREADRNKVYARTRQTFIAVQLYPAEDPDQLYDVLMYVVRHKANLSEISHVEYYFGAAWGHGVYTSKDRIKGFPIVATAYGPFLCHARVHFSDGGQSDTWRYVDFDTGMLPIPKSDT